MEKTELLLLLSSSLFFILLNLVFSSFFALFILVLVFLGAFLFFRILFIKHRHLPSFLGSSQPPLKSFCSSTASSSCTFVCLTCEEIECDKHDNRLNLSPWKCLMVEEGFNAKLQDLLSFFIVNYIETKVKKSESFCEEIRKMIKFALSSLLLRLCSVDFIRFILEDCLHLLVNHIHLFTEGKRNAKSNRVLEQYVLHEYKKAGILHPTIKSEKEELEFLKKCVDSALPFILTPKYCSNAICRNFLREFISCCLLFPMVDVITDPTTINSFIVTWFEQKERKQQKQGKMVEFLGSFVSEKKKENVLGMELKEILKDERLLFLFMSFLKNEGAVNLLQFILTLNDFNEKLLSPDLKENDLRELKTMAEEINEQYFQNSSLDFISFKDEQIKNEFQRILCYDSQKFQELQKNFCLFAAYEETYHHLEALHLNHFIDSSLFMKLIVGKRTEVYEEDNEGEVCEKERKDQRRKKERLFERKENLEDEDEDKYLHEELNDISEYSVSVTGNENKEGIEIHIEDKNGKSWRIRRKRQEFVALDEKLKRFHGSLGVSLKKDEEDNFLSQLLVCPKLKCSQLLYSFLKDEEFGTKNDQAFNDFLNSFKKLIQEKGQHLDAFLHSFIVSTLKPEREEEKPQGTPSEEAPTYQYDTRPRYVEEDEGFEEPLEEGGKIEFDSVYDCVIYLLSTKKKKKPSEQRALSLLITFEPLLKKTFDGYVETKLRQALSEMDWDTLLESLRDYLQGTGAEYNKKRKKQDEEKAFKYLSSLALSQEYLFVLFSLFQNHLLNKQVFYLIFDRFFVLLFPLLKRVN